MLFSSKVAIPALVQWCRALRHGVDIGLPPVLSKFSERATT